MSALGVNPPPPPDITPCDRACVLLLLNVGAAHQMKRSRVWIRLLRFDSFAFFYKPHSNTRASRSGCNAFFFPAGDNKVDMASQQLVPPRLIWRSFSRGLATVGVVVDRVRMLSCVENRSPIGWSLDKIVKEFLCRPNESLSFGWSWLCDVHLLRVFRV